MATIRIYLDTRRIKQNGEYPIKIVVNHKSDIMIATSISALRSQWKDGQITKTAVNYKTKNANLNNIKNEIEKKILDLERDNKLASLSDKQLKQLLTSNNEKSKNSFLQIYKQFAESREAKRTKEIYLYTLELIEQFDSEATFDRINLKWLNDFNDYLAKEGMKINTRSIHLRNIRAVFNYAIDNELTSAYPFRKFKIKTEKTRHRDLDIEDLRKIIVYEGKWSYFSDLFLLLFYLIGINLKDLLYAKKTDIVKGRLEYRRMKTKRLYSIRIEPEAQAIIDKYSDDEYLVSFIRMYKDYDGFKRGINYALKKLTDSNGEIINKDLSTYYARHSWASIAASLDVPKETISEALGHEIGSAVTSIYVNFNQRKVDEANRKVIDYLLQK